MIRWTCLVLLLGVLGCGGGGDGQFVGRTAPDFTLTAVGGQDVRLADLRGKAVIVDFWATWCPPCQALMPELQALYDQYDGRLEIVAVSVDGDPATMVPPFAAAHGYTFTLTADPRGQDVARAWGGTQGIPCTYLVDPDGVVRYHWLGKHERADYERAIRDVLGGGA
ncbi:MAG: TlpA disulfide reductase family protein [Candidatus Krumholzibacteriia bacterium]